MEKVLTETTKCMECGKLIHWRSNDEGEEFSGILSKLRYHIDNDKQCVRDRKLKEIFGIKEKLSQDWLK